MAEVLATAAALDTVNSLLGVAGGLVKAILQAREDVITAPEKTQQLLRAVESAQSCLIRLVQSGRERPLWNLVERHLRELGEELVFALEKLRKFMASDERRQASNHVLETAKSSLGIGARKQNKETLAIIERLRQVLGDLDRAVLHDSHSIAVEMASNLAEMAGRNETGRSLPHPEQGLVTRMLTLADENNESLRLKTAVSERGKPWHDPTRSAVRNPVGIRLLGRRRGAREGGYEVPNSTKVRFTMSVAYERWYFYVLTYDGWENSEPQVFFPKSANNTDNWVSSTPKSDRVFPSKSHRGDPISLKVERSSNLPDNADGHVSIFLVLSTAPLHTGMT